ncbi:microtubule nucleation factor SSNA1-like [Sabethes cyaneus]|uniref:microtubule nucleation factor SSNA1-like n=1 Tax=Sabethes cyaneus TaxID=53552 RepID=UPI00237E3E45|nr:microtubule nucleation factor SSNA1-like [Sabethes cyaneus]
MYEAAARLQTQNQEMVKWISCLREKRQKLTDKIALQLQEKKALEKEIERLRQQLLSLDQKLETNRQELQEQEIILGDAETGYIKIVDTMSELLMSVQADAKTTD